MTRHARAERLAMADLMSTVGPDAPTLCEGWAVRDLAAHIVVRERHPVAAAGIWLPAMSARTAAVQDTLAHGDFAALLADLRRPPVWSPISNPLLDEPANFAEMYIHHEDVLRAQPDWSPRPLSAEFESALFSRVRRTAGLYLRRVSLAVTLVAPDHGSVRAGKGGPEVTVTGAPGELMLFMSGRQRAARVELSGDPGAVAYLAKARLGL